MGFLVVAQPASMKMVWGNTPLGLKHFHPMKMLLGNMFLFMTKKIRELRK